MEKHNLTKKEIAELQEKLMQVCIDFINENGIDNLDEINFSADMLQESAKYGEWSPCTDSSIAAWSVETDEHGFPKRTLIQDYC